MAAGTPKVKAAEYNLVTSSQETNLLLWKVGPSQPTVSKKDIEITQSNSQSHELKLIV